MTKKKLGRPSHLEKPKSTDHENCIFCFINYNDRFPLEELRKDNIKIFINELKRIESMTWHQILIDRGLNYESIPIKQLNYTLPSNIPLDANICSMRFNKKFRVVGYRVQQYFYVIWIDENHETYNG